MSQSATRSAKGNPTKHASNTKQTQNTEDTSSTTKNAPRDPSRIAEALKPTPEQIRLATILAVKSDNSDSSVKVKQIMEVCPGVNEDEALMVLHENDYDVNRVIDYLMEGGGVSQDWKTAGTKPSKPKPSPNQTLDEDQVEAPRAPAPKDERRNRDKRAKPADRRPRPSNVDLTENGANLEEKIGFLDLKEADENGQRGQIRRGGGRGRGGRGAPRGRDARNERREPRRAQNEFINSSLKTTAEELEHNEGVLPQSDQGESNLREIGTWSNEQAGRGRRFNQRFNGQSNVQAEEYENDEEWQGDLSKTQIFTASTQKKEFAEAVQQSDFPIGHFNAEEASQNIKKAVGIGSQMSPAGPVAQTAEPNETKSKQNSKVPPSAKPLPPPTTKIPKSAVIMPDGSTSNSINFNLDLQFGVDLDDQLVNKTKNVSSQPAQQAGAKNLNYAKPAEIVGNVQKPQAQAQPATKPPQPFVSSVQAQQQSQTMAAQPQRQQFQSKESAAHLLNISPSNKLSNSNTQQQPQQVLSQLQQIQTSHQSTASVVTTNKVTPNSNPNPPTTPGGTVPPPPGVGLLNPNNLVNPNNPYLIGLPFNQNFPYFDQSQIDANLVQMYNHLANMPPPGVGAPSGQSGQQYPISDSKFPRNEVANSNAPLNAPNSGNVSGQLNQQQQQQPPINLIPYLNNYPFFFPNNPYPNMFMQIPNGGQTTPGATNQPPPPPFVNKPPYTHNFPNNQEDYANYPAQANSQMKNSSSNLSNVNDMTNSSYSKADKPQSGYHAPTPPNNFTNQLLTQQNQQGQHLGNGQSGPQPMAYIASMMGSHSGNMVHPGIQDNLNRNSGPNNLKQKYNWNQ